MFSVFITFDDNLTHFPEIKDRVCVKSLQSCPTLRDPMDCSPPNSSAHGILQARILEWVAISSCRGSSWPRDRTSVCYFCIGGQVLYYKHLVAQMVKNPPAIRETRVWSRGWEDPLEKRKTIHSIILAWRIPWAEAPGRLQSIRLQGVGHGWSHLAQHIAEPTGKLLD